MNQCQGTQLLFAANIANCDELLPPQNTPAQARHSLLKNTPTAETRLVNYHFSVANNGSSNYPIISKARRRRRKRITLRMSEKDGHELELSVKLFKKTSAQI